MEAKIYKLKPDEREGYYYIILEVNEILFESWTVWKLEQISNMFSIPMEEIDKLILEK